MTEETASPEEDIGMVPQSPVIIHKQYLKDLSFDFLLHFLGSGLIQT